MKNHSVLRIFDNEEIWAQLATIYAPDEASLAQLKATMAAAGKEQTMDKIRVITDAEILSDEPQYSEERTAVQSAYNCLLDVQNILLLSTDNKILGEISMGWVYYILANDALDVDTIIQEQFGVHEERKQVFDCLMDYMLTKDLRCLNQLIDICGTLPLDVFRLAQDYIRSGFADAEALRMLLRRICGEDAEKQAPCSVQYQEIRNERQRQEQVQKIHLAKKRPLQKKNLVLIHLESISTLIFAHNKQYMPEIERLFRQGVYFDKHYASATSTLMSISAVMYGNDCETDAYCCYDDLVLEETHTKNLFCQLREAGYETQCFAYSSAAVSNDIGNSKVWNDGENFFLPETDYDVHIEKLQTFFHAAQKNPFAVFVDSEITHCGVEDAQTILMDTFEERMILSYISLNHTVKVVMEELEKNNLLAETVVVLYGDHGDDKWTRAINSGFSHTVPPHTSVVQTPLCLLTADTEPFVIHDLVSSIDLKPTILSLLELENEDNFELGGRNILRETNQYVFSASLFLNQSEEESIQSAKMIKLNEFHKKEVKNKAFAIISDGYCLMVGNDGMSFYNIKSDYLCYNNLLSFFEMQDGELVRFKNYGAWRGHFRNEIMTDAQIFETMQAFYTMWDVLRKRLEQKYRLIQASVQHPFDFRHFQEIAGRDFRYNDY